jgi:hypothetical protein
MTAHVLVEKQLRFLCESAKEAASLSDPDRHRSMIAEAAYYRAEKRGFQPGYEVSDWVEAESEILERERRVLAPTLD